jgi:hypothetical protein
MSLPRTSIYTESRELQESDRRRNEANSAINGLAIPADARTVKGLTFTAGQTVDVAHGLTRKAVGYLVVNARAGIPLVYRTLQTEELEARLIRLTHTGAWTTLLDLVVW